MTDTDVPEDLWVSDEPTYEAKRHKCYDSVWGHVADMGDENVPVKYTPYRLKSTVDAQRAELVASSLVPGMVYCAKCDFTLTRRVIHAPSGNVGTGSNETEACPNGCGPLWSYTWRKLCDDFEKRLDQELAQRAADDKTIAALAAALQKLVSIGDLPVKKEVQRQADKIARKALSDHAPRITEANHIANGGKKVAEEQERE